ncbi:MAG: Yip1 family protein [Candidatus Kapaibacterium sp.]
MENEQQPSPKEISPLSQFRHPLEWNDEPLIIADSSVYRTIWYDPLSTFRVLLQARNSDWVTGQTTLLFVFGGIIRSINKVDVSLKDGENSGVSGKVILAIISGALLGWIFFIVYAGLLCWTGNKLLRGNAEERDYKTILAWSIVPMIVALIFTLIRVLVLDRYPEFGLLSLLTMIPEVVLDAWAVVLLVRGIKLIQSFSTLKAIVNILLPGVLFLAVIFGIGYLFDLAFGPRSIE